MTIRTDDTRATTRLYLITPPAFDPDRFARELDTEAGSELYRRDAPIVEELPFLYDDGTEEHATR